MNTILYNGFLTTLKILQSLGFVGIGLIVVLWAFQFGMSPYLVVATISLLVGVYVSTESLIAIIDLLSRIEKNTRNKGE